jgi:Asp-tRNA(Asn)/Glu-tRNA(Gln) amidotransferase A subunit family amidase
MSNLTSLSAKVLVDRMRRGSLSPVDVVEAFIARIEAVNPTINAVVAQRFDLARREAADLSRSNARGALFGLPVTIKDAIDVAGMPATCGLLSRARNIATQDAAVVARLRAAGAVVIATSNTPDNCWAQETDNLLYGRTNNPWDTARSVGGSTGGEAALIAAGASPLGIGSDIAGSIRLPAAFCGIVGLRPTSGALPEAGFWPPSVGRLAGLNALGPMARRVEDVALAWDVLRTQQPTRYDPAALRGLSLAHWFDDGLLPSSYAISAGVLATVDALQDAGMRRVTGAPAARRMAIVGWTAYQDHFEREAVSRGFGNGAALSPVGEIARALLGKSNVGSDALHYWLASHYGSLLSGAIRRDGVRWRAALRQQFMQVVGDGVAVCPVFPTTAPRHGWSVLPVLTTSYQVWVNLAGLPGLSLPVGFNGHGMPVGVQLVAAPGNEVRLLEAGMAVQAALMPQIHCPV